MRWRGREESSNIEDRRGLSGGKKLTLTGIIITAAITYFMSGGDIGAVLNAVLSQSLSQNQTSKEYKPSPKEEEYAKFVGVVLKDTEEIWSEIFSKNGMKYEKPTLVLFKGYTSSPCGGASSATGPFYCSLDKKVYIDLGFFDELHNRFHAKGDFAQAYVIAHEIGHHVQNLLGILPKVHEKQRMLNRKEANKLSVKTELQADCFAGVWARADEEKNHILEAGDIEEALYAASRIGDDTLQKESQGYVVPDSFTHGSAKQRKEWFYIGYKTKDIKACNTFRIIR